ncbi:hypothetical protein FFI16_013190 [Pseudomonas sp. KBS0710]|uniref:hypothetical protein n=1 Tax=Pseudomonas sp. KBS0710 TaxID=1179667 RepID=UPI00110DADF6|nr:hypothetical protein [Pseudomonas sp. KBS0710]TSD77332.1 hypothetical protein FFI16_013190 [Pseudomonas sp. KBS0710]
MSTPVSAKVAAILAEGPRLGQPQIEGVLNDTTGLISADNATRPITVHCPLGTDSDDFDWIEVRWQNLDLPLPNWVTLHGPVQFMLPMTGTVIDVTLSPPQGVGGFSHGRYQIEHRLFVNSFDDNNNSVPQEEFEYSSPQFLTVDRIPPYATLGSRDVPPAAQYTGSLPAGAPLTQSIINADGGLPHSIPDNNYPTASGQWAIGDTVRYYWSQGLVPLPAFEVGAQVPPRLMLQTGNTYTVSPSDITGSGQWNFFRTITDAAGNTSRPSVVSTFNVSLLPAPEQLDIFIPLAPAPVGGSLDDLLNIADYVTGISFEATYSNPQFSLDQIQWRVGTQPFTALSPTFTTLPSVISGTTLNTLIRTDYGTKKGPQPTEVQFRVVRNGETFDSPIKTINVDLSVTGGVNPGEPGSPNPNLNQAHIFGLGSTEADVIRANHANNDLTVHIMLWTAADIPTAGQWIHVVGDDGIAVAPAKQITTELPGDPFTLTIPWPSQLIKRNGKQNIHYFVAASETPGPTDNLNRAPNTEIEVIDAVMISLAAPQFVRTYGSGPSLIWNCDSMGPRPQVTPPDYDGRIFVPGDPRFVLGGTLTLFVRVLSPRVNPTINVVESYPQLITPQVKASGFTFTVPFSFLRQLRLGRVEVTSVAPLEGNISGRGNATINARTSLSASYCDFTPLPTP